MNGRFVAALGLVLAIAGVSGCIEAMSFLSSEDGEVTAMENRDLADSAAQAWSPDAKLMAVFAFENANVTDQFPSDPTPGNGRAPMWLYAYAGGESGDEHRAFQVAADGQVQVLNDSMMGAPKVGEPVDSWQIDSDRAVEIARANASFETIASQEGAVLMEALGAEEGMSVWAVMAGTPTGQAFALVDAVNGGLILAEVFEMDFDLPPMPMWGAQGSWSGPQLEMHEEGSVDASAPMMEYPFTLGRADTAHLELAYEKMLPLDAIDFHVLDKDGEEVAGGMVRTSDMSGNQAFDFTIDAPGEYTLVVGYHSMTMMPLPVGGVDYELHFIVGPMPDIEVDVEPPA